MYTVGQTGGEAEHTLTIYEMPSHLHSFGVSTYVPTLPREDIVSVYVVNRDGSTYKVPGTFPTSSWGSMNDTFNAGGNWPHNNMPPYITYYCFERIA